MFSEFKSESVMYQKHKTYGLKCTRHVQDWLHNYQNPVHNENGGQEQSITPSAESCVTAQVTTHTREVALGVLQRVRREKLVLLSNFSMLHIISPSPRLIARIHVCIDWLYIQRPFTWPLFVWLNIFMTWNEQLGATLLLSINHSCFPNHL